MIVPKLSLDIRVGLISNLDCQYAVCYILSAPKKNGTTEVACRRMIDLAVEPIPGSTRSNAICRDGRPNPSGRGCRVWDWDTVPKHFAPSSAPTVRSNLLDDGNNTIFLDCSSSKSVERVTIPSADGQGSVTFDAGVLLIWPRLASR